MDRFQLVFDKSGDCIDLEIINNIKIFHFFLENLNSNSSRLFYNEDNFANNVYTKATYLKQKLDTISPVLHNLINHSFIPNISVEELISQEVLNKLHHDWRFSQEITVNIQQLVSSSNLQTKSYGEQLRSQRLDYITDLPLAEALDILGYVHDFEEINMGIHRLEYLFCDNNIYSTVDKYNIFENNFIEEMYTDNSIVNFHFGYTYLGRDTYDKFINFDSGYTDFYCYDVLQYSFMFNLARPETIPFSKEYEVWCKDRNTKAVGRTLPIANVVDLEDNLHYYRKLLYKNLRENNGAFIRYKGQDYGV